MRHGYTNDTERIGSLVVKRYAGPGAASRRDTERRMLVALADVVPTPMVVAGDPDCVTTRFVGGRHGQDLIDAGQASRVLAECGLVLHDLHGIDPARLGRDAPDGVIQHGDFGPNNVLFTGDPLQVVAVLDWEFSDVGPAITDIAWCEWIVRMHHPGAVEALPQFFTAYGERPVWRERQAEMVRRCERLERFCRDWDADHPGVRVWQERRARTVSWLPLGDDVPD